MSYESSKAFFLDYCKYFPKGGVSNVACNAGINFKETWGSGKLPCLVSEGIADQCSRFEPRSEADADEFARRREASMQQFVERIENGQCPHCGTKVEERVQVGPCVYARPCNHRLGQGKA